MHVEPNIFCLRRAALTLPTPKVKVKVSRASHTKWYNHYKSGAHDTGQTFLKSVFKISSTFSNASSKTCTSLPNWLLGWLRINWSSGWSVHLLNLLSNATLAGQHHESGWGMHTPASSPRSGSLLDWGQDCWLARELKLWSLGFQELTVARSHAPFEQELCPVSKGHFRTSDCTNQRNGNRDILSLTFED